MAALAAWGVEHTRPDRKAQDLYDSRSFGAIALPCKNGRVFEEVVRIEIAFPPLPLSTQKNTGSR